MMTPQLPRRAVALACLATLTCSLGALADTATNHPANDPAAPAAGTSAQAATAAASPPTPISASAPADGKAVLPAVKVSGKSDDQAQVAPGGKVATAAHLGLLGNTDVMDAAFNITSFTAELLKDQAARTVGDVLLNDPSVQYTTNSGHLIENFTIRGFDVAATDLALNGSYGLLSTNHVPVELLERVELLKGPNALLGGLSPSGGVGGMINLVTKRAGTTPLTELTTSYSSGSYGQVQLDVGRRFLDNKLGVRVNAVYGDGETGVKDQEKGRKLMAVALDYQGSDWNASLDAYANRETIDNGSPGMYQMTTLGQVVTPPDSDTNMFRGTHGQADAYGALLRGEYRINDKLSTYASVGGSNTTADGLQFGTRVIVKNTAGDAAGYIYNISQITHSRTGEVGLNAQFDTGVVQHRLNLAANFMSYDYWLANVAITNYAQNIYNPVTPVFPATPTTVPQSRDDEYSGLAMADTLAMLNDRLLVTVGGRYQRVNSEHAFSPAVAVVAKPFGENASLYANYIEGLSPGATVGVGYANAGETFSPYKTEQMEAGLKLRQGGFTHTFSVFHITKPSVVTNTATNTQTVDGKQRNQGLEWNVAGQLLSNLTLQGGWSYTEAVYKRSATASLTGKSAYGVPTQAISLGAEWQTPLPGVSLNGRVIHTGEQWLNSANTLRLPAWTRVDLGASYKTKIAQTPVALRAFVENVADRNYWSGVFNDGFAMLSSPRTVRLSATVAF
ncbi:iron complex outermembrane recepter protein [Roseateles sp. YR242]|uniref:TonB-dependent receptor n=1 Tax=Roseateles sp. YR242 TaxID=1855305 RepID=UPI0008CCEB38|nr:TonB-dependent siderophore receptor [Roseateles sp. YR242]SEL22725.1 iron complex outermembrane recepter protein [Roseateles sp. YR242]